MLWESGAYGQSAPWLVCVCCNITRTDAPLIYEFTPLVDERGEFVLLSIAFNSRECQGGLLARQLLCLEPAWAETSSAEVRQMAYRRFDAVDRYCLAADGHVRSGRCLRCHRHQSH
jgi:hypothetical protein